MRQAQHHQAPTTVDQCKVKSMGWQQRQLSDKTRKLRHTPSKQKGRSVDAATGASEFVAFILLAASAAPPRAKQ